jgi:hypothetical protein
MITREEFDRWIDELENGHHLQTHGTLSDEYGYCCLGVYCEKVKGYPFNPNTLEFAFERPSGTWARSAALAPNWDMDSTKQGILTLLNDGGSNGGSEAGGGYKVRPHSFREIAAFLRHKGYEWLTSPRAATVADELVDLPEGFEL